MHSGNDSHLTPVFDCIVIIDSIAISMPRLTLTDLPGSTCSTLTSAEACYLPINLDGCNATSSVSKISSVTDVSSSGTTKGVQMNFIPRITLSGLPGGTGASLTRHVDVEAVIPKDSVETAEGTFSDLQISSAPDMSCSETIRGIQMKFTAHHMSIKLAGGTGATLTCRTNVGPVIAKDSVETGNGTSTSLQISSATNLGRSGTTRGMQINFTGRQTSSNLAGGSGATLTCRSNVGPVIARTLWRLEMGLPVTCKSALPPT
eukprot:SAG11_NODE_2665_length_3116_cov_2.047398_2_plen_261_part_00